jgi:hypothetical protein
MATRGASARRTVREPAVAEPWVPLRLEDERIGAAALGAVLDHAPGLPELRAGLPIRVQTMSPMKAMVMASHSSCFRGASV